MILFYVKESIHSFKKTKLFSFFSIISLCLSILFISISILLFFASNEINENFKKRIEAHLFLSDSIKKSNIENLKKEIVESASVANVEIVSKDEAMKRFIKETGKDFGSLLSTNPLPQHFLVKFNTNITAQDLKKFQNYFKERKGVIDVVIDYNMAMTLLNFIESAKMIILTISIILLAVSIYLIYSSSKIYINFKLEQYNTMKLVGAKLSTLKIPLLIRGFIIGLISSILSLLIFNVALITLEKVSLNIQFVNTFYFINFVIIMLGLILGPIGTGIFSKKVSLKIETKI